MYLVVSVPSEDIYDIISPFSKFSIIGRPFSITLILLAFKASSSFVIINCMPVLFSLSAAASFAASSSAASSAAVGGGGGNSSGLGSSTITAHEDISPRNSSSISP